MNEKHHDIDKLFKETFENNEVTPPFNMWSKIESNIPLTETDKVFKEALEDYEEEPQPTVWGKIKTDLPLSLTLRNGLVYLSRIAAVLLIGISVYVFFQHSTVLDHNEIAQTETQQQEFDIAAQNATIDESNVLSDDEILQEPIAMLDKPTNNYPDDNFVEYPENSPFLNPDNVAKGGGGLLVSNDFQNQAAVINIDEIARRVKSGDNSRIPSNELFKINFLEDEEETTKIDSSLIEDEKGELRNLRHKRMYDVYAYEDLDGKIRYPNTNESIESAPGIGDIPVAMSLQGTEAVDFDFNGNTAKGVVLEKKNSKFKKFLKKCKKAVSKTFNK
jgi:hypothetical protein